MRTFRLPFLGLSTVFALLSGACSSIGPVEGQACTLAADCGPVAEAVCLSGSCSVFEEDHGYGKVNVDLSFDRDLYQAAASGYVHFIMDRAPDGQTLTCSEVMARMGEYALEPDREAVVNPLLADDMNRLMEQPKYLEFHWTAGGYFFPNNLIQFIRPAEGVLAIAEGYTRTRGEGTLTSIGCENVVSVTKDTEVEATVKICAADQTSCD